MKVGEYVRTPYGIRKVKKIIVKDNYMDDGFYVEDRFIICGHKAMQEVKSSPNKIDLIEVGDYVNGIKITGVYDDDKFVNDYNLKNQKCLGTNIYDELFEEKLIYEEDIKSIVTKEQFESMEYKIGE